MAAPTAPTLTSLVTEALKKAGYSSPSSSLLTRAKDEWMEEVKHDIWTRAKKLKSLHTTSIMVTTNGQARYSMPTDFSSDMTMTLLDGNTTGTAQDGTVSTVTLASSETLGESDVIGKEILIYSGTGKGSFSQVTSYDSSTKVATVTPNFATAPTTGDEYMIVDTYYPLIQKPVWELDRTNYPSVRDRPTHFFPIGDSDYGEFILYPVPYRNSTKPWGIRLRYYANLLTLDLSSTLMSTLYQRWRNVWIQGVMVKALENDDDNRQLAVRDIYNNKLIELIMRETYGGDLSNLRCTIVDYE